MLLMKDDMRYVVRPSVQKLTTETNRFKNERNLTL